MNTFLFFRYRIRNVVFFVFSYLVKEYKYWKQSTNTANIVLLSANQIADIFRVSDKSFKVKGLSHYFPKKQLTLVKEKFESKTKKLLLNNSVIKNNVDVIILKTWLVLKSFLKCKFQVIWVKQTAFTAVFLTRAKKPRSCLSKVQKCLTGMGL